MLHMMMMLKTTVYWMRRKMAIASEDFISGFKFCKDQSSSLSNTLPLSLPPSLSPSLLSPSLPLFPDCMVWTRVLPCVASRPLSTAGAYQSLVRWCVSAASDPWSPNWPSNAQCVKIYRYYSSRHCRGDVMVMSL